jgi:segregation and condensation protein B
MNSEMLRKIIEGAIMAAGKPIDIARLETLFEEAERPPRDQIRAALEEIQAGYQDCGFELVQVASGYRFQVRQQLSEWVNRLWEEKPKRYSRAMLETLALIAYRQPLTRGDIEAVRGVAVSSDIIKSLQERDWVRVVGHRDVPGRPALYATTKQFLDYFNIKSLEYLRIISIC